MDFFSSAAKHGASIVTDINLPARNDFFHFSTEEAVKRKENSELRLVWQHLLLFTVTLRQQPNAAGGRDRIASSFPTSCTKLVFATLFLKLFQALQNNFFESPCKLRMLFLAHLNLGNAYVHMNMYSIYCISWSEFTSYVGC